MGRLGVDRVAECWLYRCFVEYSIMLSIFMVRLIDDLPHDTFQAKSVI